MATARLTVGAVLDTVGTAANTITKTLNTVTNVVDMGNAFIEKARTEQRQRYMADEEVFIDTLLQEKSQEIAEINRSALVYCRQSDEHENLFKDAYAKLEARLRPAKTNGLRVAAE